MWILRKAVTCCLVLLLACGVAHAAPVTQHLADLHRDVWTSKEGAPTDIFSITQTADGWLWMATTNGLYRFDGVQFEQFQPRPGEALLDARLANTYAGPNGALWFGYNGGGGISELRNGRVRLHAPAQPRMGHMIAAHHDREGTLWVATSTGLLRYADGVWTVMGDEHGLSGGWITSIFSDQYGNVWANSGHRLHVRRPGTQRFMPFGPAQDSQIVRPSHDGRLWIDVGKQLTMVDAPRTGPALPLRPGHGPMESDDWLFDRAGNFWTGDCPAGLCLIHASTLLGKSTFRLADVPHDALEEQSKTRGASRTIFEDAEGNIWVATSEGLERYRPNRIDRIRLDKQYEHILLGNDGPNALWIVARQPGHLWRFADGVLRPVPTESTYNGIISNIGHPTIFGSRHGMVQRAEGSLETTPVRGGDGQLLPPLEWPGGSFDGKEAWGLDAARNPVKLKDGRWRRLAELGYPSGSKALDIDRQGGVWIVYDDKVIDARPNPWRAYGKADGLDIGRLQRVVAQDTVLVLGTTGTSVRIGERFHPLRTSRPDLLANAMASTTSANGDLWINARSGLVQVQAADWKAWQNLPQSLLKVTVFDNADGVAGTMARESSHMVATDNGKRVWFVDQKGVASIDSTTIAHNRMAPRVEVLRLRAAASTFFSDEEPRLVAGTKKLSLDYTALTYIMPERIRFKYRLDGVDEQWQESRRRRTVDYTNLGPGDYRFQVLAANEDGVWGTQPATMRFSIAPLFTETWAFYALCALAVAGALVMLYRARVRSVKKHIADRTHERLYERERIARTLHDTYLQSVQGLIYVLQGEVHRQPAADGVPRPLDRALALADDVLIQGREQVMGLRLSARGGMTLEQSLAEIGRTLAERHPMACSIRSSGAARAMRGHVMEELFCIGREALQNAFRHAQGTRVDVTLHYDASKFTLSVQDDGIGFPAAMLAHGQRDGHWGLPGMRERAETVHGTLAMSNAPGGGACIVLAVPGRTAYAAQRQAWHALLRWWRRTPPVA